VRLGVSVGVAVARDDSGAESLLRCADMAMYRAKAFGKSRVEFFDPAMQQQSEHRMRLEDELRRALDEESLSLHVQPVVDLANGRIDGFEALLRWSHPTLGNVPPDVLLPVADEIGVMPRLGRWVLREAHRHAVELGSVAGRPVSIAVNVAAEQLRDEEFLAEVERVGADERLHLVLELTERALVEEATAAATLTRLHDAGVAIAIDDFGIGYSSIGYLHRFSCIDIVKIDRSFVLSVAADRRTRALVESIVAMAHAFDAVVVAEGIEDEAARAIVAGAGCALGQGFLFSPAVSLEEATGLLRRAAADAEPGVAVADVVRFPRRA
jgi:EAL domain-containing protein (putative c-di-GMP-specific phosphodiesterase class I)